MYNNVTTKTKTKYTKNGEKLLFKNPSFHFKMIYFYLFFHFFSKTTNQSTNKTNTYK